MDLRADLKSLFSNGTSPGTTDAQLKIAVCNVIAFVNVSRTAMVSRPCRLAPLQ